MLSSIIDQQKHLIQGGGHWERKRRKESETVRHRQSALNSPASQKNERVNQMQCVSTGHPKEKCQMMNKHIGGIRILKIINKKNMVTTTLGQTATRNYWTTGISKSQYIHHCRRLFSWLFTCFPFTAWWIRLCACRQANYMEMPVYKYYCHYVTQSTALSTSLTCKPAICSAESKLREDAFHPFSKSSKGPLFARHAWPILMIIQT